MSELLAEIRKIPPVTRFVCGSFLGVSLSVMGGLVSGYKVIYTYKYAFEQLQIWRIYTSFFLGSSGINYIFELVMLYRTMDQLESGPFAGRSADLAWQLFAAGVGIMIASLPMNSMFLDIAEYVLDQENTTRSDLEFVCEFAGRGYIGDLLDENVGSPAVCVAVEAESVDERGGLRGDWNRATATNLRRVLRCQGQSCLGVLFPLASRLFH
ncbi:Derlin [Mycena sanguinolenta]|uniref:Derlin n=1 Tax=Mycena sanguinolenta TaxID=230812 RepID=A0A8H7CJQ9_9AGAR|nr:Derlin [Mycena sanguinolenta]